MRIANRSLVIFLLTVLVLSSTVCAQLGGGGKPKAPARKGTTFGVLQNNQMIELDHLNPK